jgi:hypothetical protein
METGICDERLSEVLGIRMICCGKKERFFSIWNALRRKFRSPFFRLVSFPSELHWGKEILGFEIHTVCRVSDDFVQPVDFILLLFSVFVHRQFPVISIMMERT